MSFDTILGIAGTVLGVIGLITGYYFYRKSLRDKAPYVSFRENNLIQGYISKFEGLEVLYKGNKVENLTVSKVMFWNNGSETINRSDITTADPIRISSRDDTVKILDAKILTSNNPANQFSCDLSADMSNVKIDFDYLDKGNGVVIQVVHTGLWFDINAVGAIKGVKVIRRIKPYNIDRSLLPKMLLSRLRLGARTVVMFFGGLLISLFFIFMGILVFSFSTLPDQSSESEGLRYVFSGLFLLMGIMLTWDVIRMWMNRSPGGLDSFEE